MDEAHLVAAMAYVALNPVRANLVGRADDWRWSAIHAYRRPREGDGLVDHRAVEPYIEAALKIIDAGEEDVRFKALRQSETIGRPIGNDEFIRDAEKVAGRPLKAGKRGPKPKKGASQKT